MEYTINTKKYALKLVPLIIPFSPYNDPVTLHYYPHFTDEKIRLGNNKQAKITRVTKGKNKCQDPNSGMLNSDFNQGSFPYKWNSNPAVHQNHQAALKIRFLGPTPKRS